VPRDHEDQVLIRAAGHADLGRVLELWRESREAGTSPDPPAIRLLVAHDPGGLLIAEVESRVVGSLIAVWDGWRGNMYRLTVHPAWRREGIAHRLIAAGEQHLRAMGVRRITALVWRQDNRATQTWLSADYEDEVGTARFVKSIG
jgi:ribosomal protein S18 acetylase RimI-like enzyme